MKYLGILINRQKKKKYSVFRDRTGLYYLNNNECIILTGQEYSDFLQLEELKLQAVGN